MTGERASVLASLGTLYIRGQAVTWEQLHPWGARCVTAPTYPWQRERFWLDAQPATRAPTPARPMGCRGAGRWRSAPS